MSTSSLTTPLAASSTDTVLNNLQGGSPLQPKISETLSTALKSKLADAALTAKLPLLVGLINAMPAADLVTAKDLSLQAFSQQQIDPMVSGDPASRNGKFRAQPDIAAGFPAI